MSEEIPAHASPALLTPSRRLPRMQEFGLLIVTLLLSMVLWLASPAAAVKIPPKTVVDASGVETVLPGYTVEQNKFLRLRNLVPSVFTIMSWMAVMAIGQTIVIISGGIDISVGSVMGLSAFLTALVLQGPSELTADGWVWHGFDWLPLVPASIHAMLMSPMMGALIGAIVALGVGLICGLTNGLLVVGLKMHPFIVTLATLSIFRWVPLRIGISLGNKMTMPSADDRMLAPGFTDHFVAATTQRVSYGGRLVEEFQLVPMLVMLICLLLGWVYLRHMVWGRETYAVGGNEEAARFSGIRVPWVKLRVYVLSGLCAGIAGMLVCGFYKAANTGTGDGYELNVVAAAVVGGASLTGGRGTALGAVLGALVLTLVANGISVLGRINLGFVAFSVETLDTKLINGLAIILAVAVDNVSTRLMSRRTVRVGAAK